MPAAREPENAANELDGALKRQMGRGAFWLSLLTLLSSAVNYGSNLIFSRLLDPASYGDLSALLALSVVIAVPTAAAQTKIAERIAVYSRAGDWQTVRYLLRHALAHLATLATIASAVYIVLLPALIPLLGLQAPGPAIALAPLIALTFVFPVLFGALQGLGRFVAFGVVALAVALARLVVGVPWVEAGGGSGGAIIGQAVGMSLCLVAVMFVMRPHLIRRGTGAAMAGVKRKPTAAAAAAGGAFVAFAIISNFDIVLAKLFLTPQESGEYAVLANLGKVVTFLPAAVAVALVPSAAQAGKDVQARAKVLRLAAALVFGVTLFAAIPAAVAPSFVIETLFGPKYAAAVPGVLPIVCAGSGLSLLYLVVVFTVTIEDRRWTLLLVAGVLGQTGLIAAFHDSPAEVATVQAGVVVTLLIVNELVFHSLVRPRRRANRAA